MGGQYPSSYVKAPRDWSKVEAEVKQMEDKGELDEGDPLNNFFKKIFAGVGGSGWVQAGGVYGM